LAKGIKENYYDGLEEVTLDWFRQERHKPIREILAEHIARFSNDCRPYEDLALKINETDPSLHSRLLLGAEGTPLYGKLKATGLNDLLEGLESPSDFLRTIREQADKARSPPSRKVLMLTASPLDATRVRIDEEYRDVRDRIQQITSPKIKLEFALETAVRTSDLLTRLLNAEAEIFHFSGHASTSGLILEDASGASKLVDRAAIAGFFQQMAGTIKCAVLNACSTQSLANVIAAHVEVVIGCDSTANDEAAIAFSRAFYQALATGKSYEDAFDLAINDMKANGFTTDAAKYHIKRR
jgi:CHAT domain